MIDQVSVTINLQQPR